LPRGARILDLDCGTGVPIAARLAARGLEVFGIDSFPRMIERFQESCPALPPSPSACWIRLLRYDLSTPSWRGARSSSHSADLENHVFLAARR
jgi:SAM-dependent methyltransferase